MLLHQCENSLSTWCNYTCGYGVSRKLFHQNPLYTSLTLRRKPWLDKFSFETLTFNASVQFLRFILQGGEKMSKQRRLQLFGMFEASGLMVTGGLSLLHASLPRFLGLDGPLTCQLKSMLKLPMLVIKIWRVERSFNSTLVEKRRF